MQCNNKNVEWTSISKSTLQGDVKQLRKYNCKWTHRQTHKTRRKKRRKMQNRPHIQKKIVLDENSYANAGMSSLLPSYCQKAMLFLCLFSFCSFFVFWWILISLSLAFAPDTHSRTNFNMQAGWTHHLFQGRKQTLVGWLNNFFFLVFLWAGLGFV